MAKKVFRKKSISPLAKDKKKKTPAVMYPVKKPEPAPAAEPIEWREVMLTAARHLLKKRYQWEFHPDGCIQADLAPLRGAGMDVVFWRGRSGRFELAVLAMLPSGSVTLAEVMDRPLEPWTLVPEDHAVRDFPLDANTLSLVAPEPVLPLLELYARKLLGLT